MKKSIWSSSIFRITATVGKKDRKLLVYSHASVRNVSEWPTRIFPPISGRIPPTEIVGSFWLSMRIMDSMEVVVVFPWVPDTPMDVL